MSAGRPLSPFGVLIALGICQPPGSDGRARRRFAGRAVARRERGDGRQSDGAVRAASDVLRDPGGPARRSRRRARPDARRFDRDGVAARSRRARSGPASAFRHRDAVRRCRSWRSRSLRSTRPAKWAAPARATRNFGLLSLGYSTSSIGGPLIAGFMIDHAGYRAAFGLLALLPLIPVAVLGVNRRAVSGAAPGARHAMPAARTLDLIANGDLRRIFLINGDDRPRVGAAHAVHADLRECNRIVGVDDRPDPGRLRRRDVHDPAFDAAGLARACRSIACSRPRCIWPRLVYLAFPFSRNVPMLMSLSFCLGLGLGVGPADGHVAAAQPRPARADG